MLLDEPTPAAHIRNSLIVILTIIVRIVVIRVIIVVRVTVILFCSYATVIL